MALAWTLVAAYGEAYAEDLALGCERPDGSFTEPLSGVALIRRANEMTTQGEGERAARGAA